MAPALHETQNLGPGPANSEAPTSVNLKQEPPSPIQMYVLEVMQDPSCGTKLLQSRTLVLLDWNQYVESGGVTLSATWILGTKACGCLGFALFPEPLNPKF